MRRWPAIVPSIAFIIAADTPCEGDGQGAPRWPGVAAGRVARVGGEVPPTRAVAAGQGVAGASLPAALAHPAWAGHDIPERLAPAFRARGWRTAFLHHESLGRTQDGVTGRARDGAAFPLAAFDLIWPVGLGARDSFLDRMQLLRAIDQARFVNAVDALVYLHGKLALLEFQPETHVGADVDALLAVVGQGGRWVAKPIAGSFGRGVVDLAVGAARQRAILAGLTGGGAGRPCIVQRFARPAGTVEKRVLIAGREVIGAYAKSGNLAAGAVARRTALTGGERGLIGRVATRLDEQGARYAGVDLAYPYIFEANVANPGGLATLAALNGVDPAPAVARAVAAWWEAASG